MTVRRVGSAAPDGYENPLVPGLRATAHAERLADELAFAAGRTAELAGDPPGVYADIATADDVEEAIWLAFLTAYVSPAEGDEPFAGIRAAHVPWSSGELPDLTGVPLGPRTAHDPARGLDTLNAYRAWAGRAGAQERALTGEPAWTPERRAERAFERLALPGLHRGARLELLASLGRLGVVNLRPAFLQLRGTDTATVAAKRVFGIADPLLIERRAGALAQAAGVPVDAIDLALFNWERPDGRATMGASAEAPELADRGPIAAALGVA